MPGARNLTPDKDARRPPTLRRGGRLSGPRDAVCFGVVLEDGRGRPDGARLAATFYSQRIGLAGRDRGADVERHQVARSRYRVIHESRSHELAAVAVVS